MSDKLVFMVTHGVDDPERATIPFTLAVAAQTSGVDVLIGLQAEGATLAKKGVAERIAAPSFVPLKDLVSIYLGNEGKMYACGPCLASRNITKDEFIDGVTVMNAAAFVEQFITATNVLVY